MWFWIGGLVLVLLVFLVGPTWPHSPFGYAYWFLSDWIWTHSVCGVWLTRSCGWIVNEKHPLVQLFYLGLMLAALLTFGLTIGVHFDQFPAWHRWIAPLIITSPFISFFKASNSNPGEIHAHNLDKVLNLWDYDYILFTPKTCSTCEFVKYMD